MECHLCPNYVFVCVFCRQQRNSFYLQHQRSGCCECSESGVPWGWAFHLRLQPSSSSQRPPERLAMGRLWGQCQLWLPFRPGVCGRPWAWEKLPTWICRTCTHAYEPTEQRSRKNGEEINTHVIQWSIDRWKWLDSNKRLQSISFLTHSVGVKSNMIHLI